jgi:hypothetical protein
MSWTWREAPTPARLSLAAAVRLHALVQWRRMWTGGAVWAALAFAVLVAAGAAAQMRYVGGWSETIAGLPLFAVGIVGLALGGVGLRTDVEQGALELFYLRPRGPLAVPLGRWWATACVSAAVGGLAWVVAVVASLGMPVAVECAAAVRAGWAILLASLTYAAVFIAIAAWSERATVVGLGWYGLGDYLLPKFHKLWAALSPRSHALRLIEGRYPRDITPLDLLQPPATPVESLTDWLVPAESAALLAIAAVCLWAAAFRFRRSAR